MTNKILLACFVIICFIYASIDKLTKIQLKTHYYIQVAELFDNYDLLLNYLTRYEGEGSSKIKFQIVGVWIKNNPNGYKILSKHSDCQELVNSINIELFDIGIKQITACK